MKLLLWGRGSEWGAALAGLLFMITFCLDINKKLFFFSPRAESTQRAPLTCTRAFSNPLGCSPGPCRYRFTGLLADGKQRECREEAQRKNQSTAGISKRGWEQAGEEGAGSLQGAEMGQSEDFTRGGGPGRGHW